MIPPNDGAMVTFTGGVTTASSIDMVSLTVNPAVAEAPRLMAGSRRKNPSTKTTKIDRPWRSEAIKVDDMMNIKILIKRI